MLAFIDPSALPRPANCGNFLPYRPAGSGTDRTVRFRLHFCNADRLGALLKK